MENKDKIKIEKVVNNGFQNIDNILPLKDEKTGKALGDFATFYTAGKVILKEKELHEKSGNKMPYQSDVLDPELANFCEDIALAYDSKEYAAKELSDYIKRCVKIGQ